MSSLKESMYRIKEVDFDKLTAYELIDEGNQLTATILPGIGGNMISLQYRGQELMKSPSTTNAIREAPNRWGNPVLMPPNRISHGNYQFMGREYRMPTNDNTGRHHIHGLVKSAPWTVESAASDQENARSSLLLGLRSTTVSTIVDCMPIDFYLQLEFTVAGGAVTIAVRATNLDKEPMPYGIGFHPYFLAPIGRAGSLADCYLKCPATRRWELEDCFPTGRLLPVEGSYDLRDWTELENLRLDDIYTRFEESVGEPCAICELGYEDRSAGIGVSITAKSKDYPHWVIFTGSEGSGFVCLEPYTMVTNAFNLNMPKELTGMEVLESGQSADSTWHIRPYVI